MLICALAGCGANAGDAPRFLANGDSFAAEGKHTEAIIEYRNAVQADPLSGAARLKLAGAFEKNGDLRALGEYIRAADLLKDDSALQLKTGTLLMAVGRFSDALARAEAVLERDPNNVAAHILRGNALGGLNKLDDALAAMEEAILLDRGRGASYTQLALVEYARGRQGEAEAAFLKAVELSPKDVASRLALANFYWAAGRMAAAESTLRGALDLDPRHPVANRAMATFTLATGRAREAEPFLKRLADDATRPAAKFALADYYIGGGRTAEAIALLEPLARASVTAAAAKARLGRAYAALGDRSRAHAYADEVLKENPSDLPSQLLKSRLLFDDGRRDDALVQLRAAVTANPTSVPAQFALGKLYAARGDATGATTAFREVLKHNPSATAAQIELSLVQLSNETPATAVRTAEDAVRTGGDNLAARLTLVRGLLANGQYARARTEIDKLLAARPDEAAVHVQNGVLAASRNDLGAARASFNRALTLAPESIEALAGVLALELRAKQHQAVADRLSRRLSAGSPSSELLLLAGRTYAAMDDFRSAERVLRQAIDRDPTILSAYSMLGQIYVRERRLDEALVEFDRLAQRQVNPVGALTMAGIILQVQGRPAEARARLERAVAADANAAVAANNLAWLYAEAGEQLEKSLALAQSAARGMPDSPEVLNTLGWAYHLNAQPALAVPQLSRAIELDPKNATYRYHLGLALIKAGNAAQAREHLERALAMGGGLAWAADARRQLAALNAPINR
jgi:tetratricopeptide (TPR) repeat protein